jgi:hypothetical protein
MTTTDPRNQIQAAFKNVVLGDGVSLAQTAVMDNSGREVREAAPLEATITDDWAAIPIAALDAYPNLAFLDAEGFRYYIPAFIVSVWQRYYAGSMRVIAALGALYPKPDQLWNNSVRRYDALNADQRAAVSGFLAATAVRGDLDTDDQTVVERALRNYWLAYLR